MINPGIKVTIEKQQLYIRQYKKSYNSSLKLRDESMNCFVHKCQLFVNNIHGMDYFVWFAIDQDGYVGIFESRVPSPVPCDFFDISLDEYQIIHDYFEIEDYYSSHAEVANLPAVDERVREVEKKRGLYFYDSCEDDEYYSRFVVPTIPRHYSNLPDDVAQIVCKTQFPGKFSSSQIIDVLGCWDKWYGETPSRRLL